MKDIIFNFVHVLNISDFGLQLIAIRMPIAVNFRLKDVPSACRTVHECDFDTNVGQ